MPLPSWSQKFSGFVLVRVLPGLAVALGLFLGCAESTYVPVSDSKVQTDGFLPEPQTGIDGTNTPPPEVPPSLAGAGEPNYLPSIRPQNEKTFDVESAPQNWSIESVTLKCGQDDCPLSVGLLIGKTKPIYDSQKKGYFSQIRRCVATLIAPDVLVSAGHCNFLENGDSEALYFVTPSVGSRSSVLREVKEVILFQYPDTSQNPENLIYTPDYGFFRLKHAITEVSALGVSTAKIDVNSALALMVVNPEPKGDASRNFVMQAVNTCRAKNQEPIFPFSLSQNPDVVLFSGCTTRKGNSGGPLLAADGGLVGVLYGFAKIAEGPAIKTIDGADSQGSDPVKDDPEVSGPPASSLNFYVDMRCLAVPSIHSLSMDCIRIDQETYFKARRRQATEWVLGRHREVLARDESALIQNGVVFVPVLRWPSESSDWASYESGKTNSIGYYVEPTPSCVTPEFFKNKRDAESLLEAESRAFRISGETLPVKLRSDHAVAPVRLRYHLLLRTIPKKGRQIWVKEVNLKRDPARLLLPCKGGEYTKALQRIQMPEHESSGL